MLLLTALVGAQLAGLAKGNPFSQSVYSGEHIHPSTKVNPPEVSIVSPLDNRTYSTRDVSLSLNVSTRNSGTLTITDLHFISSIGIREIYYTVDWLPSENMIYQFPSILDPMNDTANFFFMGNWYDHYQDLPKIDFEKLSLNLTNVPDGNHTISVYAVGEGYEYYPFNWVNFYVTGISKVNFALDATPPKVTVLSFENRKYQSSDLPLTFTVNESVSQVSYSLDGEEAVTVAGNTTLANLPFGEHNVTVYASDIVGNTGVSETVYFSVDVPFPTTMVIAPAASVAVLGAGLAVYFKRRKR